MDCSTQRDASRFSSGATTFPHLYLDDLCPAHTMRFLFWTFRGKQMDVLAKI